MKNGSNHRLIIQEKNSKPKQLLNIENECLGVVFFIPPIQTTGY